VYTATKKILFEILYDLKSRTEFKFKNSDFKVIDDFITNRLQVYQEAHDTIKIIQNKIIFYFDRKYKLIILKNSVYLRVVYDPRKIKYRLPDNIYLSPVKLDSYKILERIKPLAYRLDLSNDIRIHPIIFVIHLEQVPTNKYNRNKP